MKTSIQPNSTASLFIKLLKNDMLIFSKNKTVKYAKTNRIMKEYSQGILTKHTV